MPYSVLKIKSVPFYNSEIILDNPIVDNYIQSNSVEIRFNTNDISSPHRAIIARWHTNIFSPTCKLNIEQTDAEIIEYDEYSKDVKLIISVSLFPICVNYSDIIFSAKLLNIKSIKSTPDNISWDEYFMSVAQLTSMRSKDMNTKVGAVLVSQDNKILGTGYNGLPTSIDESLFPKSRDGNLHETKYAYTIHAEANCLLNTTVFDISNSKLYCTLFPCNECAKLIVQKRISEIIYLSDKYHDESSYIASRKLFDAMNVSTRKYVLNRDLK